MLERRKVILMILYVFLILNKMIYELLKRRIFACQTMCDG